MEKLKKIVMLVLIIGVCLAISLHATESIKDPIAAGDVCGIIDDHECDLCQIPNNQLLAIVSVSCPDCGNGTLGNVCSGRRQMNGSDDYFYVPCYVGGHPSGCQTVQSRYYTDIACSNCEYRESGSTSHIQAYFHSKDSSVSDNHYCTLDYVYSPNSSVIIDEIYDNCLNMKDPIAAGDVCDIISDHECKFCN